MIPVRSLTAMALMALVLAANTAAQGGAMVRAAPEAVDLTGIVLTDASGEERPLDQILPEGPAVLHVWATWCVPCRDELPAVERFADALATAGIGERLVVVSVDRSAYGRVMAFVRDELGLPDLRTWQEVTRRLGPAFRLFGYPATLFLDAEHRVVARHPGALDWDDEAVRRELFSHLRNATPSDRQRPDG